MKHAILGAVLAAMLAGLIALPYTFILSAPSGITHRVLVSNALGVGSNAEGTVQIINAAKDALTGSTISAGRALWG